MYHWQRYQKLIQAHKSEIKYYTRIVNRVIQHLGTSRVNVSRQFSAVYNYLHDRFSTVNITDIPVYLSPASVMNKHKEFKNIGGCFIPHMEVILIKDESGQCSFIPRRKFDRLLYEYRASVDIEDIVVHELLHAISSKLGRASRKRGHMEEEFVYSNCVDFYKQKGMSEDEIVTKNFLPFCIEDVFSMPGEMKKIISKLETSGISTDQAYGTEQEHNRFVSRHAEVIVSGIVARAIELGQQVINLSQDKPVLPDAPNLTELRFASLDFS